MKTWTLLSALDIPASQVLSKATEEGLWPQNDPCSKLPTAKFVMVARFERLEWLSLIVNLRLASASPPNPKP